MEHSDLTGTTPPGANLTYTATVPVVADVDVLVVGGGPAGIAAALASARNGARTMLVEKNGYLGGNLTAGLVGPCMTSYSLDGEQQLIRGIFEELVLKMEAMGGAIHPSKIPAGSAWCGFIEFGHDKVTPFDPEALKGRRFATWEDLWAAVEAATGYWNAHATPLSGAGDGAIDRHAVPALAASRSSHELPGWST